MLMVTDEANIIIAMDYVMDFRLAYLDWSFDNSKGQHGRWNGML